MFAQNSFARRMPLGIPAQQRIAFASLAYAINSIQLNHNRSRELALLSKPWLHSPYPHSDHDKLIFLNAAWSIIDSAHQIKRIRDFLSSRQFRIVFPALEEFCKNTANATTLRNKLQHLKQNIDNIANRKKQEFLFGSFSYIALNEEDLYSSKTRRIEDICFYTIVLVYGDAIRQETAVKFEHIRGKTFKPPVGCFTLFAFDLAFDIDMAFNNSCEIEQFIENCLIEEMMEKIKNVAEKKGHNPEIMLSNNSSDYSFVVKWRIAPELENTVFKMVRVPHDAEQAPAPQAEREES